MFFRTVLLIFFCVFLHSCSTNEPVDEIDEEIINCSTTNIAISEQDSIVVNHATNPVIWKGNYSDDYVTIYYTIPAGLDGETERFTFIFSKLENCLKVERAYKYYDGKAVDVSAITQMKITEFYIHNWEKDKKFSGLVFYIDPHDKNTYSRKFWVEFTEDDKEEINNNYLFFNDCLGSKLPIEIDMNNDNIVDFKLDYETINDTGNNPNYNRYTVKLISTFENQNKILSPEKSRGPYTVLFEPPFTSENKKQYFNEVKNELDVFYEFEEPYQKYNFFLNNNLTYKGVLDNSKDDYYIVSMTIDNKLYYGWIKFSFNAQNCEVQVLETYLNNIENEHIFVSN